MIVKNEEKVLGRCLRSVQDAVDEIIIIDTGSTDKTKLIASGYTNKVYDFMWIQDFAAARNEAFSKATMDYQMWLDADDVLPPESQKKLKELRASLDPAVDIVMMKYLTHFDEQGLPILSVSRERLLKREKGYKWQDPVHEFIPLEGNILHSDIEVHHKKEKSAEASTRNLDIYANLKSFTPRQTYYYARELKDHQMWVNAVYYFEKFLATKEGWVEDNIAACYNLSICYAALGDRINILPILLKSMEYDTPRAEICSEIGYYFKNAKQYAVALRWFELGAGLTKPETIGFVLEDYWGYIPCIEACVCSCYLGEYEKARMYNEKAATFKPNAAAVDINRKYLDSRL